MTVENRYYGISTVPLLVRLPLANGFFGLVPGRFFMCTVCSFSAKYRTYNAKDVERPLFYPCVLNCSTGPPRNMYKIAATVQLNRWRFKKHFEKFFSVYFTFVRKVFFRRLAMSSQFRHHDRCSSSYPRRDSSHRRDFGATRPRRHAPYSNHYHRRDSGVTRHGGNGWTGHGEVSCDVLL